MIGDLVGSYRIVSRLGAGGMGAVWLAEHTLLGRHVAIKFLLAEVSQSPAIVDRFFAEARAATRIADPGIVVVYDFGWHTNGAAYIVMEHLAGESVQARLRHGRFAVVDAVRVVQQTAMAMAVAHGAGIIHRDLKPDNLFLVPDPVAPGGERIKVLDFGIAKLLGDEHGNPSRTRTGLIMGTPTYMSPEQCRGAADVDHRTDIYALGCVLFHLLCGRLPFLASTPADMISAHLRETPPLPSMFVPQIPITIDEITMRCLAKQAGDRYGSMTELARALAAAIGALSEIASIVPLRATPPDRGSRPVLGAPANAAPVVPRNAQTVAGSTGPGPPYSQGAQPSTFSRSTGESIPPVPRAGRWLAVLVALGALGAVVVTIAIATSRSSESSHAPGRGAAPPDPPPEVGVAPAIDASIDGAPAAAPNDAALRSGPPLDAPKRSGPPLDAPKRSGPPLDAPKPRPRPPDSGYDPYANP
jgi:eukaryotic-like serine/threonine-protein kinase